MTLTYPAIVYERKGGYTIEVPDISGCKNRAASLGRLITEGTNNASGRILSMLEHQKPVPKASPGEAICPGPGGFVIVLVLDMDAFVEKFGHKAIRKNVTVPAWLNTFAEEENLNFSRILRDALQDIYFRRQ